MASVKEWVLIDVLGRSAEIKSHFGTAPAAGRKHFIADAGHFMPVDMAAFVDRRVDTRLRNRFAGFILHPHFEAPFNRLRVLFSNETLLEQLDQITIGGSTNSAPLALGSFGSALSSLASYFHFRGTRRIPIG